MQNIFVYGTLLSPEITKKLTGKSFETVPASLKGFKIYCVKDCDYPAIVPENGADTSGKIIINVDDIDLIILSLYEGDEYKQRKVKVLCNNKMVDALTFVWVIGNESLENREWDFEGFQRERLDFYLEELCQ